MRGSSSGPPQSIERNAGLGDLEDGRAGIVEMLGGRRDRVR